MSFKNFLKCWKKMKVIKNSASAVLQ